MVNFIDLDISQLHKIIRIYNLETKIIPPKKKLSQLSKAELVAEIDKHLELRDDKIYFRQKTNNFEIPKASKPRPVNPDAPVRPKKPSKSDIIEQLKKRIIELEKIIEEGKRPAPRAEPRAEPKVETKKEKFNLQKYRDRLYEKRDELARKLITINNNISKAGKLGDEEKVVSLIKIYDKMHNIEIKFSNIINNLRKKPTKEEQNNLTDLLKEFNNYHSSIKEGPKERPKEEPKEEPKAEKLIPKIDFERVRKKLYKISKKEDIKHYLVLLKDKKFMKELKRVYESGDLPEIMKSAIRVYKKETDETKQAQLLNKIDIFNAFIELYIKLLENPKIKDEEIVISV